MLTAIQQERLSARPCGCGVATLDSIGNVLRVESCPACLENALDFLKVMCYDPREDVETRERQLDMFPNIPSASDLKCDSYLAWVKEKR